MTHLPDPFTEIRATEPRTVRGANYWSRRPVTRFDVTLGAFDDIPSCDVPEFGERLVSALPGLFEHACSLGRPGGFVERLQQGTYAGHIAEHVAIELQGMSGMPVAYGRTRGTGKRGDYTVVFEHRHGAVGQRTARAAIDIVQRAYLDTVDNVPDIVEELRTLAKSPEASPLSRHVVCGVTGQHGRQMVHAAMRQSLTYFGVASLLNDLDDSTLLVDVSPAYILESGLPYTHSDIALILDAKPGDVPSPYREPDRAGRLVSVVAEAVPRGGSVICPDDTPYVHAMIERAGRQVVTFPPHADLTEHTRHAAACAATVLRDVLQADRRRTTASSIA